MRGHGQSDAPANEDYSVKSLAADIGSVVDGLNIERFALVGHSMGGAAALTYAGENPKRVAGLVLVGTPGKSSPEQAAQVMKMLEADYEKTMDDYWKQLTTDAKPQALEKLDVGRRKIPKDRSLKIIKEIFAYDPEPALQNYKGPTLILSTPSEDQQPGALAKLAPDVPHKTVSGTSHWMQMDKPGEFNQILDEFLGSVGTGEKDRSAPKI